MVTKKRTTGKAKEKLKLKKETIKDLKSKKSGAITISHLSPARSRPR